MCKSKDLEKNWKSQGKFDYIRKKDKNIPQNAICFFWFSAAFTSLELTFLFQHFEGSLTDYAE